MCLVCKTKYFTFMSTEHNILHLFNHVNKTKYLFDNAICFNYIYICIHMYVYRYIHCKRRYVQV